MPYSITIDSSKGLRVYGPHATAGVTIEIDFVSNFSKISADAYVLDGRGGLSYAYLFVNSGGKVQFASADVSSIKIDGVTQSWTSNVTPFVGSGLDTIAGKTLSVTLTNTTFSGGYDDKLFICSKYTSADYGAAEISGVRFVVGGSPIINYLLDEGTGTTVADSLAVAANGTIVGGDGSEWNLLGGSDTTVSATQATQNASVSASSTAPVGTATVAATQAVQNAALSASATSPAGGTITTGPFKNNTTTVQTGLTGLRVVVIDLTDGSTVLNSAGHSTHATTAVMTFSDAALTPGTTYGIVTIASDGSAVGIERIQAS